MCVKLSPCCSALVQVLSSYCCVTCSIKWYNILNHQVEPNTCLEQQSSFSEVYEQHSSTLKLCYSDRRLAMIAIAAFVAQELVEKKEIVHQVGPEGAADSAPPQ